MTISQTFIVHMLLCILTALPIQTLSPISSTDRHVARLLAGAFVATAGGFGISKTKSTLKTRKKISRKILRALSVFAVLSGAALSLQASFRLKKKFVDSKKLMAQGQTTLAAIPPAQGSQTRSLHSLTDQQSEGSRKSDDSDDDETLDCNLSTDSDGSFYSQSSDDSDDTHSTFASDDSSDADDFSGTKSGDSVSFSYSQSSDDSDDQHSISGSSKASLYISDDSLSERSSSDDDSPAPEVLECRDNTNTELLQSSYTSTAERCSDDGRLYAGAGTGAGAVAHGTTSLSQQQRDTPIQEVIAPWDPRSSAKSTSYFKASILDIKRMALEKAQPLIDIIIEKHNSQYIEIDDMKEIPKDYILALRLDNSPYGYLKNHLRSQAERNDVATQCTHYKESYIINGSYLILKTSLYDKERTLHTNISMVIPYKKSFLEKHRSKKFKCGKSGGPFFYNMFIEHRSLLSCVYKPDSPVYITSLNLTHPEDESERIAINFNEDIPGYHIERISIAARQESEIFSKEIIAATKSDRTYSFQVDYYIRYESKSKQCWTSSALGSYYFKDRNLSQLTKISIDIPQGINYTSIFDTISKKWNHFLTYPISKKTIKFESDSPLQKIGPEIIAQKIINGVLHPTLDALPCIKIASRAFSFLPSKIPSLPYLATQGMAIFLHNVHDMHKSIKTAYAMLDKKIFSHIKHVLNCDLTYMDQVSLLLNVPRVSAILTEYLTKTELPDLQKTILTQLITSMKLIHKKSPQASATDGIEKIISFYQKHKHVITKKTVPGYSDFAQTLHALAESLTAHWNRIPLDDRNALLATLHELCSDPQLKTLTAKYIPLSEYMQMYTISTREALQLHTALSLSLKKMTPENQDRLQRYSHALHKRSLNQSFDYREINYDPFLELLHTYLTTLSKEETLLQRLQKNPDSIPSYFVRSFPDVPHKTPMWQPYITHILTTFIELPLRIKYLDYRASLAFGNDKQKLLIPILQPIFNHILTCLHSKSIDALITNIETLREEIDIQIHEHAHEFECLFPATLLETIARNPSEQMKAIKKHCYCMIIEKMFEAIKPENTDSGLAVFLTGRKNSIITAIQEDRLTEYTLNAIQTCMTYLLTATSPKPCNSITLCTFKNVGMIQHGSISIAISKYVQKYIPKKRQHESKQLLKKLIPLYNRCVPLANYCISVIQNKVNQFPLTSLNALLPVIQDALWYFS